MTQAALHAVTGNLHGGRSVYLLVALLWGCWVLMGSCPEQRDGCGCNCMAAKGDAEGVVCV